MLIKTQKEQTIMMHPSLLIKNRDKRCSRGCIINWTKYNQKPPKYQICECNKNNLLIKNK